MIDKVIAGRYRITEKIGIGGMAEVFKATDETLGRTVAVKVMLPQYAADETFAVRFKQEAQAAANLQSPYIVNIYDWGFEETTNTYYIVMEYIRGTDLKTAITQRGAINQRKVAEIGAQVAAALGVAHGYDVIHRDIKPQNIMVQPDGNAKVMDFGIARSNNANMTQTGSVLGTAYYVSPEQAQGKGLTASTDIYSLGVVLYEAVCGRVPFEGPDAVSIAVKQVNEQPVPPRAIDNTIDVALEAIIMKAMQKNPADRFNTAHEMRLALTEFLQGKPLSNVDPNARTRVIAAPAVAPSTQGAATAVMPQLATAATHTRAVGGNGGARGREIEQKNSARTAIIVALVAVLVVALASVGLYFAFCSQNSPAGNIEVPDVRNKTEEEARALLKEAKLEVGEIKQDTSDTVEEGQVISQDPAPKSKVAEGTKVTLTISTGTGSVTVPDLRGRTPDEARRELEALKLVYKTGTSKADPDIPEGSICSQSPSANNKVKEGTEVVCDISTGVKMGDIPNVYGMPQTNAEQQIVAAGFKVNAVEGEYSDMPAGNVMQQDKVGEAKEGEIVTITISKGPKPPDPTASIPNVYGMSEANARAAIEKEGFVVAIEEGYSDVPAGNVMNQDKVGTANKGDTVTITISKGPKPASTP